MSATQANVSNRARAGGKLLARILVVLAVAIAAGYLLHRASAAMAKDPQPAGFGRGLLQGALMPVALPNLLVGNDVTIYAQNNTGRRYKLGYTLGVNACGIVFFGFLFWRLNRWKSRRVGKTRK
jgi:hypothetical protein